MLHEEETIYFAGEDWQKIKRWCERQMAKKMERLINSECDQDEVNRIRGNLAMMKQLLALEKDAAKAAQRTNVND